MFWMYNKIHKFLDKVNENLLRKTISNSFDIQQIHLKKCTEKIVLYIVPQYTTGDLLLFFNTIGRTTRIPTSRCKQTAHSYYYG